MTLPSKQYDALQALLTEPNHKLAAEKVGISYRTIKRWLTEPAFSAAYDLAVEEAFHEGLRFVRAKFLAACERLYAESESTSPNKVRVTAANALITHALRVWENVDLERRISDLEAQHEKHGEPPAAAGEGQEETA